MRKTVYYSILILFISASCRNSNLRTNNSNNEKADSVFGITGERTTDSAKTVLAVTQTKVNTTVPGAKKAAKSIEFEIVSLNPDDSSHKMSFYHSDYKYYHRDSLYCEVLYNLSEVKLAIKNANREGDFVTMMIEGRPQGSMDYYQIALYRMRATLDKMDRVDFYRISIKNKVIEKRDVVRDKWVKIK